MFINSRKLLLPLLLSSSAPSSHALKCGKWNTHACIGETDIRYDPDYTNNLGKQDKLWDLQAGFWRLTQESSQIMAPFNPFDLSGTIGFPYDDSATISFSNITVTGSRRIENRYSIYPPAPQEFCDLETKPGELNALGGGQCGVNGWASFAENYLTSSHEKDGSGVLLGNAFGFSFDTGFDSSLNGKAYPVGDKQIAFISNGDRDDGGRGFQMDTFVFTTDDFKNAQSTTERFNSNNGERIASIRYSYTRLPNEEAFINGVKAAWDANNVQSDVASRGGEVPMQTECLGASCPTEEDWCQTDPNCSDSPYQEPPGKRKAGVVAGFVIAAAAIVLGIVIGVYNLRLKRQRERIRLDFATRIAETISSPDISMDPDALKKEFQRIDSGKEDGGDGYISKDELKDYMASGKFGEMDEKDFNVLYLALDADGNGKVDYLEFCSFLRLCAGNITKRDKLEEA